jgi:hypothetical protein
LAYICLPASFTKSYRNDYYDKRNDPHVCNILCTGYGIFFGFKRTGTGAKKRKTGLRMGVGRQECSPLGVPLTGYMKSGYHVLNYGLLTAILSAGSPWLDIWTCKINRLNDQCAANKIKIPAALPAGFFQAG